jgi:chemotaxis protein MotB
MKNAPVIVIKKKKGHGHGHHGGAWKVAYADFVTAMMAFFLVLWIVGQSQAVKNSVAGYFRDPGVFEFERSTGILPGSTTGISPEGPPSLKQVAVRSAADRQALEQKAATLRAMLQKPEMAGMKDQVEIQMTRDGLRIELLEKSDSLFFDSGSAALKEHTIRLLQAIARELGSLDNPIVLEGHTDSRRYTASRAYTNWELSADRANAARRVMDGVLPSGRLSEVRGYADTRLRYPADPLDPRNRRVSIIVGNHDAEAEPAPVVQDLLQPPAVAPTAPPATH